MNKFYELCLGGTDLWLEDKYRFLQNYFVQEGASVTALLIAFIVALVALAIFYGIFGMFFPKVGENRWVWLGFLILTFVATWFITESVIIGNNDSLTGVYGSMDNWMSENILPDCGTDQTEIAEAHQAYDTMVTNLQEGYSCSLLVWLYGINSGISIFLYFLLSVGVKKLTKYSQNVPF